MMVLLEQINQKYGTTMLLVTHNMVICEMMHQVIEIKDGKIAQDYTNKTRVSAAKLAW